MTNESSAVAAARRLLNEVWITKERGQFRDDIECVARAALSAAPELPTNDEFESLWETTHQGHPADFAADVLERWGGWQPGLLGYGGALSAAPVSPPEPNVDQIEREARAVEEAEALDEAADRASLEAVLEDFCEASGTYFVETYRPSAKTRQMVSNPIRRDDLLMLIHTARGIGAEGQDAQRLWGGARRARSAGRAQDTRPTHQERGDTVKLSAFVEGLNILRPHYEGGDGHHLGAEHDQFYAYETATPLSDAEVARMRELGWFQPEQEDNAPYSPTDGWSAFV